MSCLNGYYLSVGCAIVVPVSSERNLSGDSTKAKGENTLPQRVPDLDVARRQLLERLDRHPVKTWSIPLILCVIGILDAHGVACDMGFDAMQDVPTLRVVR
jgi:hypothetical protein